MAAFAIGLSCSGNGSAPRVRDLHVVSAAPTGPIEKPEQVTIRFDKPVVDAAMVGKPVIPGSVAVSPAFAWNGFWQDAQTLVIDPTERLAPSTTYSVALAGELAARAGGFAMTFVHRPLVPQGLAGMDAEMIPPDGELPLSFNQPVKPADVAAHCDLIDHETEAHVGLLAKPLAPAAQTVAVKPVTPLVRGRQYDLHCADLIGDGGNTPLDAPYSLPVTVRPPLAVESIEPAGEIAADNATITIKFTTPMTLDAARAAVHTTPEIPNLAARSYLDDSTTSLVITGDLDSQTDYTLTIANAVDKFGQSQEKPFVHKFKTGDAQPRISMERGIYALEASAKGYPVWSRNITKYEVECAAIPKQRLVQVVTTDMNYDAWGGNNDDKPLDWKALKIKPQLTNFRSTVKNKWRVDELALGKTCGGTTRGVFLAEVRSSEIVPDKHQGWLAPRRNRVLANVTDLGVMVKAGTSSGIVWVTSLASGTPVDAAKVTIWTPAGKLVHTATTDKDGIAKIPGTSILKQQAPLPEDIGEGDWDGYRSQRLIAIVERGDDLAVVDGNWSNGIQLWNFGINSDRSGGAIKIRGFIQSDRGLYRPGETVHFKGLAREIASGKAPRVPTGKRVDIEVQDSRGQVVMHDTRALSPFGGFAFDLALAAEASVGDYYVAAKLADQTFREKFSVEEFRPATFEVKLASRNPRPQPGEQLAFELTARHLMGTPADGAAVEWGLRKRPHIVEFPGYESYSFAIDANEYWSSRWHYRDDYGEFISDGKGVTNAQGSLMIEARDPATEFTGPVDYILSASVTDNADQTMGKSTIVTAHKTGFYLGMHANEFVQAAGMPFGVNLVALSPDGARVATKAKLSVIRSSAICDWLDHGGRSYQNCKNQQVPAIERAISIASAGSHTERINLADPGDYIIRVEATDQRGNPVVASSYVWVVGKGEAFWSGDEGARMSVIASKASYAIGDTARLVAQANLVQPTALITVERDGIIDARVRRMASTGEGIELKIDSGWAPNVFASVALVAGRHGVGDRNRPQFKMGVVELKVATERKQLDVAVVLDKKTVAPGERVAGKITVSEGGKPVKAEVSLSAADEGILQLIAYETPNPLKTFYASYGLGVDSATNWNRIARLADPTKGDPDEGGDAAGAGQPRVRSNFVSSAYWAPMLVTDDKGEVAFAFTAPDNLTAFRLMAVAADIADRFGAGEQRLTVNKPLMVAPALPRLLRAGDIASVGVVVHNNSDHAGTATVTAKALGATLDATQRVVTLPANGSARVRFAATASDNAAAEFEFAIGFGGMHDAAKVTLPIGRPRIYDNRLLVETGLPERGAWKGKLDSASDVLRDDSELAITVDRTGVGELAPGLRSLVEYPYGCLEQTMSRFVPLVAAKELSTTLDQWPNLQGTQAEAFIRAGVAKVVRHQQGDGHFSLWPQSQTYPHLTAYALWGLTVAERAGEKVPSETFDRGIAAMTAWANQSGTIKPDGSGAVAAMGAYVMALRGKPDPALNARLYNLRSGLPKWGQSFLLRAMKLAKADPKQISELTQLVEAGIEVTGDRALVHERAGGDDYHYMNSDIRASAMALLALMEVDPTNRRIDPLATGIKAARDRAGNWVSTQETLWSLVALSEYGRRARAGDTTVTVRANGSTIASRKVVGSEVASLRFPLTKLANGALEIAVDHPAVVTARVREARRDAQLASANGFTIERSYRDAKNNPITSAKAGELVTVQIAVSTGEARKWIALVDSVPAGLEVVNPKLAAGGTDSDRQPTDRWTGSWIVWAHQELRDDRVQWFADDMRPGTYIMKYQARATIDGTFSVMPASIEAMYQPQLRARTAKSTFVVTP